MVMWQHFKLSSVESIQTRTSRNQAVHPLNTSNLTLRGQIVQSLEHILSTVALSVLLKTFIRYIHYGLGLVTCSVHARPCPFERRESFASKRDVLLIGRQRLCLQQLPTLLLPENGLDRFQEVLLGVWRTASWTRKKHGDVSRELPLIDGHVPCCHSNTYLQQSWNDLSGRPSDSDLAWMISHTAIPSESERKEEKGNLHLFFGNSCHEFLSLYQAIRHLPLGDLMFTWKRETVMKAACRLSYNHTFALFTTVMNGSPHQRECAVMHEHQSSVRKWWLIRNSNW